MRFFGYNRLGVAAIGASVPQTEASRSFIQQNSFSKWRMRKVTVELQWGVLCGVLYRKYLGLPVQVKKRFKCTCRSKDRSS